MVRFQNKKKNAKIVGAVLIISLLCFMAFELLQQKPSTVSLSGKLPPLEQVEFNLRLLRQYNTPTGSVLSDIRGLFAGDFSTPPYSIIKYDLTSALFLMIMPLLTMFGILMSLGVSKRTLAVIMLVFGVFTFLPLFLI
jgi:hypothetical protein